MTKRPSLFAVSSKEATKPDAVASEASRVEAAPPKVTLPASVSATRPKSRQGKRIASVYLEPEALRQIQKIAFDEETTVQALLCEGINAVFEARSLTRLA